MKECYDKCDYCDKKIKKGATKHLVIAGTIDESKWTKAVTFDMHKKCLKEIKPKLECIGKKIGDDSVCAICGRPIRDDELRMRIAEFGDIAITSALKMLAFHKECIHEDTFFEDIEGRYQKLCKSPLDFGPLPPIRLVGFGKGDGWK